MDATLSPDGRRVFGVTADEVVELDAQTGALRRSVLSIPHDRFASLAVSPDGTLLAVRSTRKRAILDLRSGFVSDVELPRSSDASVWEQGPVARWSFSPDSRSLISAVGNSCILWRAPDWAPLSTHRANALIRSVIISPDQRKIAIATRTVVEVWSQGFARRIVSIPANQPTSVAFSNDSHYLAWGDYGAIHVVDLRTLRSTEWAGHRGLVGAAVFSPDGKWLAVAGADDVRIWDWHLRRQVRSFGRYPGGATVNFFPDGGNLLVGGGSIDIWDLGQFQPEMRGDDEIYTLAFSADGSYFASAGNDGQIVLWSTASRTRLRRFYVGERTAYIAFLSANSMLVNTVRRALVWNLATGELVGVVAESAGGVLAVVAPDGKTIAIADAATRELKVMDTATRLMRVRKSLETVPMSLAFTRDSRTIAVGLFDGQVQVFSGSGDWRLSGGRGIARALAFSSTGAQLLVGHDSAQINAWDWRRQRTIMTLEGHSAPIKCIQFSPDGARVVSTSDDGTMKIWDGHTFEEIVTFPESEQSIEVSAFSVDSRFLAAAGDDRRIRLWDGSHLP